MPAEQTQETALEVIPPHVESMMLAHLALTGDLKQRRAWKERLEDVRQMQMVEQAPDERTRGVLRNRRAYRQMRAAGGLAQAWTMGPAALWMSWLIPVYAVAHGFGWLAAMAYLLPVPFAYRVGRQLWEQAALSSMVELDARPDAKLSTAAKSAFRAFNAGFGFTFTLVFLQGLISWFMTPAETIGLELFLDGLLAGVAGIMSGTAAVAMTPLVARAAPPAYPQLASGE